MGAARSRESPIRRMGGRARRRRRRSRARQQQGGRHAASAGVRRARQASRTAATARASEAPPGTTRSRGHVQATATCGDHDANAPTPTRRTAAPARWLRAEAAGASRGALMVGASSRLDAALAILARARRASGSRRARRGTRRCAGPASARCRPQPSSCSTVAVERWMPVVAPSPARRPRRRGPRRLAPPRAAPRSAARPRARAARFTAVRSARGAGPPARSSASAHARSRGHRHQPGAAHRARHVHVDARGHRASPWADSLTGAGGAWSSPPSSRDCRHDRQHSGERPDDDGRTRALRHPPKV